MRIDRHGLWDITVHAYNDRSKYGYGIAIVTDRHGKEVYRFDVRLEGVGGRDRSKANSDTPLGVYDIPDENMWISGGDRGGYGANHRLVLNGESGEIKESGRGLIRIHGGRQEVYDAKTGLWKPISNAQLKKTQGCLRCADEDVKTLKQITDDLMKKDKKEKGGKLTIMDDLMEVTANNPIPFKGTSTTYVNPGENATTEEKNKWNNIIKELFGTK
nr:L,D-transpeptidase family protein [Pedobacter psychroterrae]